MTGMLLILQQHARSAGANLSSGGSLSKAFRSAVLGYLVGCDTRHVKRLGATVAAACQDQRELVLAHGMIGHSAWRSLGEFTSLAESMTCPEVGHEIVL
jgi:hypothetical protein